MTRIDKVRKIIFFVQLTFEGFRLATIRVSNSRYVRIQSSPLYDTDQIFVSTGMLNAWLD